MSRFDCLVRYLLLLALCPAVAACSPSIATKDIAASTHVGTAVTSGFYDGSLTHTGHERTFTVYIPPGYDGQTPMPLIVALHGGLGTGKILEEQTHLSAAANAHGYIVAYPDGIGRAWNAGSCCGEPAEQNIDDVGFIAALVAQLTERYAIDTRRVYATGFSNGAMMVHRIACEKPNLLAGFAAVSGGPMADSCKSVNKPTPAPALLIQGTEDPRIPWEGGTVNDSYRMAFMEVVDRLAGRNACSTDKRKVYSSGDTTCWARSSCTAPVHYCVIKGGGHQWPGGETVLHFLLGDNTNDYNASARIAEFFDQLAEQQ